MREEIIKRLAAVTEEEERLLLGERKIERRLYTALPGEFTVNSYRLSGKAERVALRRHTRFAEFPMHGHNYVEMMYVLSGSVFHTVGEDEIRMQAGDLLVLSRHARHAIKRTAEGDLAVNLVLSVERFSAMASTLLPTAPLAVLAAGNLREGGKGEYLLFHTKGDLPLENLFENLLYLATRENAPSAPLLEETVSLLIHHLAAISPAVSAAGRNRPQRALLRARIEEYIEAEFRTATLSELAGRLGLSTPYLSARVRTLFGMTFSELLHIRRFLEAARLLSETDLPVGEIIVSVGYENSSFFHNEFKKRYGTSPLHYRKRGNE